MKGNKEIGFHYKCSSICVICALRGCDAKQAEVFLHVIIKSVNGYFIQLLLACTLTVDYK